MKQRIFSLLAALCWMFLFPVYGQHSYEKEAVLLWKLLDKNHYLQKPLDDQLSKQVFIRFINLLDSRHLYFTSADIKTLTAYELFIDDDLKGKSWKFLPQIIPLYKQRLLGAEKTFTEVLNQPLNLTANEKINLTDAENLDFSGSESELTQRWTRWLKFQTLWQMSNFFTDDSNKTVPDKIVMAKEAELRQKVKIIETRTIKRILDHPEGFENYVISLFFEAVTTSFDPHSAYFTKSAWQSFESALSRDSYSFGIDIRENDKGAIEIVRLVPGGPAWKSNELHTGDILLELKWEGKNAIDLTGANVEEIESILASSASDKLELTVRKTDGLLKKVYLMKEKIRDEENIVKSYILNGERKIGYISLPGFYSEWENMSGNGCANDVAKEILKLKEEGINGLIMDIRYNGGGSLAEGLNLAGIFINEGPLLMLQGKDKKPVVMKDMNRGTVYDGPLIVMVNGQSASASEVLASTLQDYNRAVIVGSRTYGKATGQTVLPLDSAAHPDPESLARLNSPYGIAKITTEKLYRVNGKSSQIFGVTPDVYCPDVYEKLNYRESSYPNVIPGDSVSKKVIYTPLSPLPVRILQEKSAKRINNDPQFQVVKKLGDAFPAIIDDMEHMPLNFTEFRSKIQSVAAWRKNMEQAEEKKSDIYKVDNTSYEKELLNVDAYGKEINDVIIKKISKDIYIQESFQILNDLINLKNQ